jgi:hypothetical protein
MQIKLNVLFWLSMWVWGSRPGCDLAICDFLSFPRGWDSPPAPQFFTPYLDSTARRNRPPSAGPRPT